MNAIGRQGTNNNSAKSVNKISVSVYKGTLSGNIIPTIPIIPTPAICDNNLDFSCQDNSEYIPLI